MKNKCDGRGLSVATLAICMALATSPAIAHPTRIELISEGCGNCTFSAELLESSPPEQSSPWLCVSNIQPQAYRLGGQKRLGVLLDGVSETEDGSKTSAVVVLYPPAADAMMFDNKPLCVKKWSTNGDLVSSLRSVRAPDANTGSRGLKEIFQTLFGVQNSGYATVAVETPLPATILLPDRSKIIFPTNPKSVLQYMLNKAVLIFPNNVIRPFSSCGKSEKNKILYISC